MQHDAAVELLASTPMFRGLGGELLKAIVQRGETCRYGVDQPFVVAGAPADRTLFILEGKASLVSPEGNKLELKLEPGMSLNDMAMFVDTSHYYGAVAEDEVTVFALMRDAMSQLILEHPYLAAHFARCIKQILTLTAESLHQLYDDLARSMPEIPEVKLMPLPNGAAVEAANGVTNSSVNGGATGLAADFDAQVASGASNGVLDGVANHMEFGPPVQDLLADLSAARGDADQIPPEPEHDQRAFPSPAPRRSRGARQQTFSEPGSPIYDQAAGHDSSPANFARGSSTR